MESRDLAVHGGADANRPPPHPAAPDSEVPCLCEPSFWLRQDRDDALAILRRTLPVSWQEEPCTAWSPGGRGYWAVLRHADVYSVSRNPDTFVSGLGTELFDLPVDVARAYSGMLSMDAPRHGLLRRIVSARFSAGSAARLEPRIRQRAVQIIEAAAERGSCDFARDIADPLPVAVVCDMIEVPEADRPEIARLSRLSVPLGDQEFGGRDDALSAARSLVEYSKALQRERRQCPADDLVTVLANAEVDGRPLAEDDAGPFFELLITAGTETTGTAIAHGMLALSQHPAARRLWAADFRAYAPRAIEEILRWSTPVLHFRRTAAKDAVIAGQHISAGDKVVLFYLAANRDETVFANPGWFDIARDPNPHVGFGGGGPHFCLGAHLARLEMRVMFEELFRRLPDLEVGVPVPMHSMFFNGFKALPCSFTARPRSARGR